MYDTLLNQFIAEEFDARMWRQFEEAIVDPAVVRRRFEFNRFEVTIDRAGGFVLIEDVLDASDAGAQEVPLAAFVAALRGGSG